jgi:hypothetical protein
MMIEKIKTVPAHVSTFVATIQKKLVALQSDEHGDVPGWVLITVMTAGLVVAIWSIAGPELKSVLNHALRTVKTP